MVNNKYHDKSEFVSFCLYLFMKNWNSQTVQTKILNYFKHSQQSWMSNIFRVLWAAVTTKNAKTVKWYKLKRFGLAVCDETA